VKYGQIAANTSINSAIYRAFEHLSERDARSFVRKFREQPQDDDRVMHTFRELVLGGFLAANGLPVRHEHAILGKTPDWVLVTEQERVQGIIELVYFHAPRRIESAMEERHKAGKVWVGRVPPNAPRLYSRLQEKASAYCPLAEATGVPYVVAVFGDSKANLDLDDVRDCVLDTQAGLFMLNPELSGVMFFEEQSGRYAFSYIQNQNARRSIALPSGQFL
jgi:hypothetical protein